MGIKKLLKVLILSSVVLTVMALAACEKPPRMPSLGPDDVVLAFGDSITYGTGAAAGESYPVVLEKIIGRRVVNAGIPGDVTSGGLARLPDVLDAEKPRILLLCLGGNDFLRRLNKQAAAANIREMIRISREKGVAVVMIAVPSLGFSVSPDPLYREIARELNVPLEEKTLSAILSDRSLKSDYIHPNAAGYRRLAEAAAALLRKSGAIE